MSEINITNDRKIIISKAKSHNSTNWENESLMLSDFINRISSSYYTNETTEQFKNMDKENKDKIKNCIGGFVGGALRENGKRNNDNIKNRCLITLDIDHCSTSIENQLKDIEYSYAIYSTHSHREDYQRYRLIIPIDRDVSPIEYESIARMAAYKIDKTMDMFDDTTYESARLMYWPSTPKGGTYYFKYHNGEFLKADEILGEYIFGWEDRSSWPVSSRKSKKIISDIKKQQDPLGKKGIIGAFCRTYTIQEAIDEYLSDVYRLSDDESRATYINGSTSNGVVIYDDKFSYSHHSTDPAGDILVNSFDLVRILKFSHLDEGVRPNTKTENLPSFIEMKKLAASDKKVIETQKIERIEEAKEEFGEEIAADEVDDSWKSKLTRNDSGYAKTIENFRLIIENDFLIKDRYYYDEFEQIPKVIKKLPWSRKDEDFKEEQEWSDTDDSGLKSYIEKYYTSIPENKYKDALNLAFNNNSIHPVREYIKGLTWDGEYRLETLFIDYLGAEDTKYNRMVAKKLLVAAITRVFIPGTKYDEMAILVSTRQGVGKSTLVRKLGKRWFSDSLTFNDIKSDVKKAVEQTEGSWIIEMPELKGLSSKDADAIKAFMSGTEDKTRKAYARRVGKVKRQYILIGTTNNQEFLSDRTGNRRYLPVITDINIPTKDVFNLSKDKIHLDDEIDQIWAEAYSYYKEDYPIYLNEEEKALALEMQELCTYSSDEESDFEEYLNTPILKPIDKNKDWYSLSLDERLHFLYPIEEFSEDPKGQEEKKIETERRNKICIVAVYDEFINKKYPLKYQSLDRGLETEIKNMLIKAGWKKYIKSRGRMKFGVYGLKVAYIK
ncbi:hypothetical protein GKZ28_14680 [Clostridium chromiireducens]|uniref:RGS domain-containing protein n=1 Tax=Clostridium chromiireducens TaxID=225345 RepID=A0A964RNQ1_9CLOT|nr:virulence-associated E family protein [Clostridium chromiireducens]MVX64938.1 hypothetical protein [Clostridium chromiireducens]